MAPTDITLWHAIECPFSMRVRLVLREKDLRYDSRVVALGDEGPEVKRLNPKGRVPVLKDGGCVVYDAGVIAQYLEDRYAEPPLFPSEPSMRARARMLMNWSNNIVLPSLEPLEHARLEGAPPREPLEPGLQDHLQRTLQGLHTLAGVLGDKPYLLGDFGIADIFMAPFLTELDAIGVRRDDIPARTAEWIDRLRDRPSIAEEIERRLEAMPQLRITA